MELTTAGLVDFVIDAGHGYQARADVAAFFPNTRLASPVSTSGIPFAVRSSRSARARLITARWRRPLRRQAGRVGCWLKKNG